jgi:hypothetical protein
MFAPAIVGAEMRLSARPFEPGRSTLLNSAGPIAEGWHSALLSVKPGNIAPRRSDANGKMRRSPAPADLGSASIDFDDGTSCGRGRLLRRPATRSLHPRPWRGASRRVFGRVMSQAMFTPTGHLRRGAVRLRAVSKISAMNHQGRILTWLL